MVSKRRFHYWLNFSFKDGEHVEIHLPSSFYVSSKKNAIKAIKQANFNCIWKSKTHFIKKGTMVIGYEEGGLKALDIDCINAVKINWLRSVFEKSKQLLQTCQHVRILRTRHAF